MSNRVITMYSKDNCVQCNASERKMKELGLKFEYEDATTDKNQVLIKKLDKSYMRAPVLSVSVDGVIVEHWSGYQPAKLEALVV